MTMTILWTGMVVLSILCGLATGQSAQVAAAAVEGTQAAVELCLSIAGMLCLWTGVMEVMRRSGLAEKLSRLLRPMLRLLFPQVARDRETMDSIAGAGQRCHPSGAGGRPADEPLQPRGGFRCAVHAGGVQYGLHPTDPHHGGHGAGWGRERRSL